jgi:hypothetical protein
MHVDKEPNGCDFNDSPLGDKHCHYEKKFTGLNSDGQQLIFGTDNETGRRVTSHDGGKTWEWWKPDQDIDIYVHWERVQD